MRMFLDKAVDMSTDGGNSAEKSVVRYFGRIGKMRFILDLDCNYPKADYKKLIDRDIEDAKDDSNDVAIASKLTLNNTANAATIDFYDKSKADEFDEEHAGWMAEYKYSWPAFAFENIKPDALFWSAIKRVKKNFIRGIFE